MANKKPVDFRSLKRAVAAAALGALLSASSQVARAGLPDATRFGVALEMGNLLAARAWLDEGLDPNFLADRIGTGLMIGAWEGNLPMMELFLSRGADINMANANGEQALMHAAWRGRLEAVRWLIERGARVNRKGRQWSALHYAVFAGHEKVAQLLIENGADINARSTNGSSVLMMAAREGREGLAKQLVSLGADTGVKNDRGEDAALWAIRHDHARIAAVVSSPDRFAEAVRDRGNAGPAVRSVPVPDRIDALVREMRVAESEGRLSEDLRAAYAAALAELERNKAAAVTESARATQPKALEITARRGEPGKEQAMLIYERGPDEPLSEAPPPNQSKPKKKASAAPAAESK